MFNWYKVFVLHSLAVGHSQREAHDWSIERAPNVDDAITALEQLLCVLGCMKRDTFSGRHWRLVDVYTLDRIAISDWSTGCVIKEDHFVCTRNIVQQELLDLRIVYATYPLIVLELCFCALDILVCVERVVVEIKLLLLATQIIQCYFFPVIAPVSLWNTGEWLDVVVWR